jgi:hypothetical protein
MENLELILTVTVILLYLLVGIFVYTKYLSDKRRFGRFERIAFGAIVFSFMPVFIFLIIAKFMGWIVWGLFTVAVFGLIILNLIYIFGQYLNEVFIRWRLEQMRNRLLEMPDCPEKRYLEKKQEFWELIIKNR